MFQCFRLKRSLPGLVCLAALISCSTGYARRAFFTDVVTLPFEGVVSDLQLSGDVNAQFSDLRTIKLTQKMADQGYCSGSIITEAYYWDYQAHDITFCAGMGTVSFTYTTALGDVCHVTLNDGADVATPSIVSSDCLYEFTQTSYFNKFSLNFLSQ